MPKVTLTLYDELFQECAGYAAQEGMEVDKFLSWEIQQRAAQLLPAALKAWMPVLVITRSGKLMCAEPVTRWIGPSRVMRAVK